MRIRPLAALSVAALSAVLLAGCAGGTPDATPTPSGTGAGADLCSVAAPSGDVSESVTVSGEVGAEASAEFESPLEVASAERTVIVEGDGDAIEEGSLVNYAATIFDASTGEVLEASGYDSEIPPAPVTVGSGADQFFGCATVGSRIVMAVPATEQAPALVWVLDVLGIAPTAAWGEPQEPVEGMPEVELAEDGTPSVTIPDADAPTELEVAVLKEGDGEVVAEGDTTTLQYYGVDWETGETFDDSWSKGAPISLPGNTYVPGFVEALVGQPVGSQVLVVIPPAQAYGEAGESDHELAGKTLVFVIDILSTQHADAAAE
ncbi:FKBP-type peptidyl-prolyl cis-trans isomerase [Microbacterium flavescens]|uniref:FKBP-type peptidyl-prolyl cis-trans isomerase n=1 Tax=Microbacterium flavescens TaxID=69366 RepID=UPI001BDF3163|nr:FKBP-type peptidyl-prolyl cis-trans isomerase [Microbacterium flavescens]